MNQERFREPMDAWAIRARLTGGHDVAYQLAARATGHQSACIVDPLASKIRVVLPELVAQLAAQVEAENLDIREPCDPTIIVQGGALTATFGQLVNRAAGSA